MPTRPAPGGKRPAFRLLTLAGLALASPALPAREPAPPPWSDALRFEYNLADDAFARLHEASPGDARLALARASTLLARQPRTQSNIVEARALLERLAAASAADADIALAARFLLARIAQDHLVPPRLDEARERYESLLSDHAGKPVADQAAVHLALLAAYPPAGESPAPPAAVQARIDSLRSRVRAPAALRELHALQGRLYLNQGDSRSALPHLLAARAIGYRQPDRDSEADLSIGNVARETGDPALALTHYQAFVRERRRDPRVATVQRIIDELRQDSPRP